MSQINKKNWKTAEADFEIFPRWGAEITGGVQVREPLAGVRGGASGSRGLGAEPPAGEIFFKQ